MTCRPCGRGYRVPHADRVWSCKQCGEPLAPLESPDPAEADATPAPDKDELRRINAELKRWRKSHKALKAYFILGPGVIGVMVGAAATLLAFLYGALLAALVLAVVTIGLGFFARWVFGFADRKPVPALLTFAILYTVIAVAIVVTASLQQEPHDGRYYALICFGAWAGVLQARRSERVLESIPDAYRRKAVDERAKPSGPSVRERHRERVKLEGKRESRVAAWILGGVALAVALGSAGYWYSQRPYDPAPTLQSFRESWERGDVDGIAFHADSPVVDVDLRRYWRKQDWIDQPPSLRGWNQTEWSDERVKVDYELSDGRISKTIWEWSEGHWRLDSFGPPR